MICEAVLSGSYLYPHLLPFSPQNTMLQPFQALCTCSFLMFFPKYQNSAPFLFSSDLLLKGHLPSKVFLGPLTERKRLPYQHFISTSLTYFFSLIFTAVLKLCILFTYLLYLSLLLKWKHHESPHDFFFFFGLFCSLLCIHYLE